MQEKIRKIIDNNIFLCIIICAAAAKLIYDFVIPLQAIDIDRAWEYGLAKYMAHGSMLYTDLNICVPPLYYELMAAILRICDSYTVFCVAEAIINCCILLCVYFIARTGSISKRSALIVSAAIAIMIPWGQFSGYNILVILFAMISLVLIMRTIQSQYLSGLRIVFIAMVASLAILSKHSSGLFVVLAAFISVIYLQWNYTKNKKRVIIAAFLFILGDVIIIGACGILLWMRGTLLESLSMIFGVGSFSTGAFIYAETAYATILLGMAILWYAIRHYTQNPTWVGVGVIYMVAMLNNTFPLPNISHLMFAIIFIWIFYCIAVAKSYERAPAAKELIKDIKLELLGFLITAIIIIVVCAFSYNNNEKVQIIIDQEQCDAVWDVIQEDPEHQYIFLHQYSMYLHYTHGQSYEKYFDLFTDGNFGGQNPLTLVQNAECDYFIVTADQAWAFWQFNPDAMNYIYSLELVNTIGTYEDGSPVFSIYKQK